MREGAITNSSTRPTNKSNYWAAGGLSTSFSTKRRILGWGGAARNEMRLALLPPKRLRSHERTCNRAVTTALYAGLERLAIPG